MNRRKMAFIASLLSLCILSGCRTKMKTVEIDGDEYIMNGEEYTKINLEDKVFEPGTHIIHYIDIPHSESSTLSDKEINQGYGNGAFYIGEPPEGYKLVGVTSYANSSGNDNHIVYIFVNEKTVVAKASFDPYGREVVYETPGQIVDEPSLNLEP